MQTKPNTHGGKRPNSGRKKGEPTVTFSYRVKVAHRAEIDRQIKNLLKTGFEI